MRVLVWIAEDGWRAAVDAAPDGAELALVHVHPSDLDDVAHGAFSGLFGRGHADPDPGDRLESIASQAESELLTAAAERAGRPVEQLRRHGRVEREVVAAAAGFDLLIVARDGDTSRLGPKSLGRHARFIVDHAPCPVLLIWPGATPGVDSIPAPKHHPPHDHHPPNPPPPPPPHRS
jgi:nucleotide-binding universal stress UspA family protein